MGAWFNTLSTVFLLAMLGIVTHAAYAQGVTVENFQPDAQVANPGSNITQPADSSNSGQMEHAEKRNSDPLRYAVAFTAFVFVSLVVIFVFLTRRKRRMGK